MRKAHLKYLACPACKGNLLLAKADDQGDRIETGLLECQACPARYPIMRHIPRFVASDGYAREFGFQWTKHARTQFDSYTGTTISQARFFEETKWPIRKNKMVLGELGSKVLLMIRSLGLDGSLVLSRWPPWMIKAFG